MADQLGGYPDYIASSAPSTALPGYPDVANSVMPRFVQRPTALQAIQIGLYGHDRPEFQNLNVMLNDGRAVSLPDYVKAYMDALGTKRGTSRDALNKADTLILGMPTHDNPDLNYQGRDVIARQALIDAGEPGGQGMPFGMEGAVTGSLAKMYGEAGRKAAREMKIDPLYNPMYTGEVKEGASGIYQLAHASLTELASKLPQILRDARHAAADAVGGAAFYPYGEGDSAGVSRDVEGALNGPLSPVADSTPMMGTVDALGQWAQGFVNNPDPGKQRLRRFIDGAADLGTYLVPFVGQAKVAIDTAGIGESYLEKLQKQNPFEAAGSTLGELGEGMNPFSFSNLNPEERVLRGLAALMLYDGAKKGFKAAKERYGEILDDPRVANFRDTLKIGMSGVPWAQALEGDGLTRAFKKAVTNPGEAINQVIDNWRAKRPEQMPAVDTGAPEPAVAEPMAGPMEPAPQTGSPAEEPVQAKAQIAPNTDGDLMRTPDRPVTGDPVQDATGAYEEAMRRRAEAAQERIKAAGVADESPMVELADRRAEMGEWPTYTKIRGADDLVFALKDKFHLDAPVARATAALADSVMSTVAEASGTAKPALYEKYFAGVGKEGDIVPNLHGPGDILRMAIPDSRAPMPVPMEPELVRERPGQVAAATVTQATREGLPIAPEARKIVELANVSPLEQKAYDNIRSIWDAARHNEHGPEGAIHQQTVMVDGNPLTMYTRKTGDGSEFLAFEDPSARRETIQPFDPARAAVDFLKDGRALVTALNSPDASSFAHEFAHIMRRIGGDHPEMFEPGQWNALEEWAGVKQAHWDEAAEEKFADAYERYLQNGRAPTSKLQAIFDQFRQWMTRLYQQLKGDAQVDLSPAVEAIFDRMHGDWLEEKATKRERAAQEIQANQEARAMADQREREYLLSIDPDDPRIDPFEEDGKRDSGLVTRIKEFFGEGEGDMRTPAMMIEDARLAEYALRSSMDIGNEGTAEAKEFVAEALRAKRRNPDADPHALNYWRQDANGKWRPDGRNTLDAVSTNGWPDYLVRMLFDFVNHHYVDPETRIAEVNDRNTPGMDRPPRGYQLSEFVTKEGDGNTADGGFWNDHQVPRPVLEAFSDYLNSSDNRFYQRGKVKWNQKREKKVDVQTMAEWAVERRRTQGIDEARLRRVVQAQFGLDGAGVERVLDRMQWVDAAHKVIELGASGATAEEMRATIEKEFPAVSKTRRDKLIKEALSDAGLPSPSELFKTARGRIGEYAKRLVDDPSAQGFNSLQLADYAKKAYKIGTQIASEIAQKAIERRAYEDVIRVSDQHGTYKQMRDAVFDNHPEIKQTRIKHVVRDALDEAGIVHPNDLMHQWAGMDRDTFDNFSHDMADMAVAKLKDLGTVSAVAKWVRSQFGLSSDQVRHVMGRVEEQVSGRRIVELAKQGLDYRTITETMAKEYPNIPLARYRDVVSKALAAGGMPHATEIIKGVDPETGGTVYRRGRMIVGAGSVMIPEELVAKMGEWQKQPAKFLPFWSEARIVEKLTERDPMVYQWLVHNREQAVRDLSGELAQYRQTLIDRFGKRFLRDKGVQEHVFKYGQTWYEADGEKVPYTLDDLKKNRPNDWEKCKEQAEFIRAEYETLRDRANAVRRKFGRDEIPYIQDYMTHMGEVKSIWDVLWDRNPLDMHQVIDRLRRGDIQWDNGPIQLHREFMRRWRGGDEAIPSRGSNAGRSYPEMGFAKQREGLKTRYDAATNFEAYVRAILTEIHLTEPAVKRRTMVKAIEANQAVTGLSGVAQYLRDQASHLVGDRAPVDAEIQRALFSPEYGRKVFRALDWMINRMAANKASGNLRIAMYHSLRLPIVASMVGADTFAKAAWADMVTRVFKLPDATTDSAWLKQRFEDTRAVTGGRIDDIQDFFSAPSQFIETAMVRSAWRAFHMQGLNNGMSAADALAYADKMAGRVVPSRARGEGFPTMQTRLGRTLFQFQTESAEFAQFMAHDFKWNELEGRPVTTREMLARSAQLWIGMWIVGRFLEETTGTSPVPDPVEGLLESFRILGGNDEPGVKAGRVVGHAAAQVLGRIPGGNLLTSFMPKEDRMRWFGDVELSKFNGVPAFPDTLSKIGNQAQRGDMPAFAGSLITELALPFGGTQLRHTYQGVKAVATGEHRWGDKPNQSFKVDGVYDALRAIAFGPDATTAAKFVHHEEYEKALERGHSRD